MNPIRPTPRLVSALVVLAWAVLVTCGDGLHADEVAEFTVDARLGEVMADGVDVRLECWSEKTGEPPSVQSARLPRYGSTVFRARVSPGRISTCFVSADTPPGIEVLYRGDGGSEADVGQTGCRFAGVKAGHANFCQIQARSPVTSVTVYKKWIGAAREEPDVRVELVCGGAPVGEGRLINVGKPGAWILDTTDPEGVTCNVFETGRDEFVPDPADCRGLLVLPGSEEECTLVNTKVVKMIEMLNRYGLVIMILVFMAAGMLAARRFVP